MHWKPANKQQLGIWALVFLLALLVGCETQYDPRFYIARKIDEHMAHTEAHQLQQTALFSFMPPKGRDWVIYEKDGTNVMLQTSVSIPRWEMDALAFPTDSTFKSHDDFLAFIKPHRLQFKPGEELLESTFVPCEQFGKFCIKYEWKAKVHLVLAGKEGDYIFISHGYDFIHPTRPDWRINVAFSEMNETGSSDDKELKEFEDSISTLTFK